jgi:hypothetical protein
MYLREIADVAYRIVVENDVYPLIGILDAHDSHCYPICGHNKKDIAAGFLALAHKDILAGIHGWLASIVLN